MSVFGNSDFSNWEYLPPKRPGERVEHTCDFSERLKEGDEVDYARWESAPNDGHLAFTNTSSTPSTASVYIEGGSDNTFYRVTCRAETQQGLAYEQMLILPIGPDLYKEPETLRIERAAFMTRQFLRDYPEENELDFGELEHSWADVKRAVRQALQDWNAKQPPSQDTLETLPEEARGLLYKRSAVELLRSAAQGQARNRYNYSDQGFQVSENDKAGLYMQLAQQINREYEQKAQKLKAALNAQTFWGGSSSAPGYYGRHRW